MKQNVKCNQGQTKVCGNRRNGILSCTTLTFSILGSFSLIWIDSTRVGNIARGVFQRNHFQKGILGKFYSRWCLLFQVKWASEKISMIWKRWFEFKTIRNFLSILISSNVFIWLPLGSTDSTDYADWLWDASDENRNSYFQKMNLLMWTR